MSLARFTPEQVDALSVVANEADRRGLAASIETIVAWPERWVQKLDAGGAGDLAERVRAVLAEPRQ